VHLDIDVGKHALARLHGDGGLARWGRGSVQNQRHLVRSSKEQSAYRQCLFEAELSRSRTDASETEISAEPLLLRWGQLSLR